MARDNSIFFFYYIFILVTISGCAYALPIRVPNCQSDNLVILLGADAEDPDAPGPHVSTVDVIDVETDRVLWSLWHDDKGGQFHELKGFRYGDVPEHFVPMTTPLPLRQGQRVDVFVTWAGGHQSKWIEIGAVPCLVFPDD